MNNDIGSQLKSARLSSGLSINEIAEDLRLSKDKIESLESNQFEDIAAPTYVSGYIRAYCKAVNLDAEPIVKLFLDSNVSAEPELSSTSNQPAQINAKDPLFIMMTAGVVLLLLVLLIVWSWESFSTKGELSEENKLPEIELVLEEESGSITKAGMLDVLEDKSAPVTQEILEDDTGDKELNKEIETVQSETDDELVNQAKPLLSQLKEIELELVPEKEKVVVEAGGQAPSGKDKMLISVKEESWVNVQDANGYRLYYDMLYSSSGSIKLRGQAPFRVVLGNAPSTSLRINGKEYNLKSFIRADKSAKFSVK